MKWRRALWMILVIQIVVVIYLAFTSFSDLKTMEIEDVVGECDLQQNVCQVISKVFGTLTVEFTSRPVKTTKEFEVKVTVADKNSSLEEIALDLEGVGMSMGYNRPLLEHTGGGVYVGVGFLPVCTQEMRDWKMTLLLSQKSHVVAIPFYFKILGLKAAKDDG